MSIIRINYDLTIRKAKQIIDLGSDIIAIKSQLDNIKEESGAYWRGDAANTYREQCSILAAKLTEIDTKINKLGNKIINIANVIKAADEEAARQADNLG